LLLTIYAACSIEVVAESMLDERVRGLTEVRYSIL